MDSSAFSGASEVIAALFCVAAVVVVAIIGVLALVHQQTTEPDWQREAIERGYALHCPATGEFAWKGECEDD